ncbi:hypothetical protein HJ137_23770 [Vibrio parahaemolyticus]|nr:hypothetical protein [Vibrio parahaemolyticus]
MINWTEPFEVAKERAKVMKLPLLWIVLISLFSGVFAGVSFYVIASLTNNSLHVDMLFFHRPVSCRWRGVYNVKDRYCATIN